MERLKCFSRIVPAFPVILPSPSIITMWSSSNLEPLSAANSEVPGLSATVFHGIVFTIFVSPIVSLEIERVCASYQSLTFVGVMDFVPPLNRLETAANSSTH